MTLNYKKDIIYDHSAQGFPLLIIKVQCKFI